MNGENCKVKGCLSKCLLPLIAVFAFIVVADYLIHAVWLASAYEQTANLWRTKEDMKQFAPWMLLYQAILAVLLTGLYCKSKKSCSCKCEDSANQCPKQGALCFGIVIGLLFGVMHAAAYIWMPIPLSLAAKWFIGGVAEGVGIGVVLAVCTCGKKGEGNTLEKK